LFELAAEYALGIVKNHPFLDGNKRAGFMAAYTFLGVNGYDLNATEADAVIQTLALASGEIKQQDYAVWLKASCKKAKRP
jgi:death-on-curing protein